MQNLNTKQIKQTGKLAIFGDIFLHLADLRGGHIHTRCVIINQHVKNREGVREIKREMERKRDVVSLKTMLCRNNIVCPCGLLGRAERLPIEPCYRDKMC